MDYLLAIATLIAGILGGWLIAARKLNDVRGSFEEKEKNLISRASEFESQKLVIQETLRIKTDELSNALKQAEKYKESANHYAIELAALKVVNDNLDEKLEKQKVELEELQQKLTAEFENIAHKVLKQRSDEFSASNNKNLSEILQPLKEKIQSFEKKVEDTYEKELRDKISLREEVKKLTELNNRVSEEANNLTKALKGDVKKQGNWGEIILERVLERSGLSKGQEYEREEVVEGADNSIQRPDVIVHLPDNKHVVIDSKVSLIAYEKLTNAETEEQQTIFLREHIQSLRTHVKQLSERNYQHAQNINSPDFVLMFVPIEASFSSALQSDNELFSYAWERKIVIVSPTTLLATLRTIASIWKQENQTKNAQEIARLGGSLYDKFIGFLEDLEKIKKNIDNTSKSYDDALRKLKDGKGNLIVTAIKIKELGAKTSNNKVLPTGFDNF